jgi:hypothetical protein
MPFGMTTPFTVLRSVLTQWAKTAIVLCTDGGANDGKGVEVTGTSDGAVNVNLAGGGGLSGLATAANQVTGNASLAAILAKIIAAPATEAKQDTGNTSLASLDAKLVTNAIGLNPSSAARGSQAATNSAVALGGATTYTAGIFIWNSDTANYVTVGTGTPTDGAGANRVVLGPGQGYQEPTGDLSALKIIAATGSPIVNWIGMTK